MSLERRIARLEAQNDSAPSVVDAWQQAFLDAIARRQARVRLRMAARLPGVEADHPAVVDARERLAGDSAAQAAEDETTIATWDAAHPWPEHDGVRERLTARLELIARRLQDHEG